jgi:hypothetical protein
MNEKICVIDSGTMITFSSTCMMNIFVNFVKKNNLRLIVSNDVSSESVWKPIKNKRFALNAARIKHLFNSGVVDVINQGEASSIERQILDLANNSFFVNNRPIEIIQRGEAEALSLAKANNSKVLFIDERTTRSLLENPLRLKQILEKRRKQTITTNDDNIQKLRDMFSDLLIFRSVDVIALAYKQGLFETELDGGKLELEAALYACKFSGCSVSEKEIQEYLKNN